MSISYPALTIWQPWASLIAAGAKPHEWRGWPAPNAYIGKRIAIHAGARKPSQREMHELLYQLRTEGEAGTSLVPSVAIPLLEKWASAPGMLPLRSVLCLATLGTPITAGEYATGRRGIDSDRIDHQKWGWPLRDIHVLTPFVPATGAQGIWTWRQS